MEPALLGGVLLQEGPHVAHGGLDEALRRAGKEDAPVVDHHEAVAHRLHVLDDVGGEEHQPVLGRAGEQVAEVDALLRVQTHRGLVKDQEGRVPSRAWEMPTRWRWPPERVRIFALAFSSRFTAWITR